MPKFNVWLTADTLLYMPAFALVDLGILERVAVSSEIQDASICVQISPARGDRACIEHMLRQAEDDQSTIHIALADPIKSWQADPDAKRVSLLGALIKRPPFWEIGRVPAQEHTQHKYAYYNETFATGNFLGRRAAASADDDDREPCRFGEEFAFLDSEAQPGQFRVITADIRRMQELIERDPTVTIHRRFAKDEDLNNFITTGILSHKRYAKSQKRELALFMEAIRAACILLRTAEAPTASLVEQIMLRGPENDGVAPEVGSAATAATAGAIAKELFKNEVYANSLTATHAEWDGALKPRPMESAERRKASRYFYKIYNPHPSRDMTEDWLIRAIKDYGRFALEARRLRGASIFNLVSTMLLAINVLFADQAMRSVGAQHWLIHYTSIGAIVVSAGTLAAVTLALIRERPTVLLRFQSHFALDDELAMPLLVSFLTLLALAVLYIPANFVFHAPPSADTIWSYLAGTLGVIFYSAVTMWRRRDA